MMLGCGNGPVKRLLFHSEAPTGASGAKSDVDLLNRRGYTRAVNLYNRETL